LQDTWDHLSRFAGRRGMVFIRDEQTGAPFADPSARRPWRPIVEALIRPVDQCALDRPQGDCDDFAMYAAAHLIARGVPCAFVTVAADPEDSRIYSHVYLVAYPQSGPWAGWRVPLDFSHGETLGWEVQHLGRLREWPIAPSFPWLAWLLAGAAVLAAYLGYQRWLA